MTPATNDVHPRRASSFVLDTAAVAAIYPGDTGYSNSRNWRRLLARMLDLYLFGVAADVLLYVAAPTFVAEINKLHSVAVNSVILTFCAILIDGIVLGAFGQTPAKALAGIHVTTLRGARLTFAQALNRSLSVWINGLGGGLPIVTLITMYRADRRVAKEGHASWDNNRYVVSFTPIRKLRFVALALSVPAVFLMIAWLSVQV